MVGAELTAVGAHGLESATLHTLAGDGQAGGGDGLTDEAHEFGGLATGELDKVITHFAGLEEIALAGSDTGEAGEDHLAEFFDAWGMGFALRWRRLDLRHGDDGQMAAVAQLDAGIVMGVGQLDGQGVDDVAEEARELGSTVDEKILGGEAAHVSLCACDHLVEVIDNDDEAAELIFGQLQDGFANHLIGGGHPVSGVWLQRGADLAACLRATTQSGGEGGHAGFKFNALEFDLAKSQLLQALPAVLEIARSEGDAKRFTKLGSDLADDGDENLGKVDVIGIEFLFRLDLDDEVFFAIGAGLFQALTELPEFRAFATAAMAGEDLAGGAVGKEDFLPEPLHGAAVTAHVIKIDVKALLALMKRRRIEGVVNAFEEVAHADEGVAACDTA